jgi:MoaA/NifB/PqqE/SkfB family radical SAM enzyme
VDTIERPDLSLELARSIFDSLGDVDDIALTLGGLGDPLLHDQFDEFIEMAKDAGFDAIHCRTELLAEHSTLQRLLACAPQVISIDLHADRAATYETMMGHDRFKEVLLNLDFLLANRRRLTRHDNLADFALPWIVPRLQRRAETYDDLETFYDRWSRALGTAVIESPPPHEDSTHFTPDSLMPAGRPQHVERNTLMGRLTIFSDGSVPFSELDVKGENQAGHVTNQSISEIWRSLLDHRRTRDAKELRTFLP